MTIAASGPAAAFLQPQQQQDGSWAIVLTARPQAPDPAGYALTLTETEAGYSNSPHAAPAKTIIFEEDQDEPQLGTVAALDSRTVILSRVQTSAPTWAAPFDPSDNAPYVIDVLQFLGTALDLDTVTGVRVSPTAALAGVEIDGGIRRPMVDRSNKRIALWFKVDPDHTEAPAFTTGVIAGITVTFTTGGARPETYQRTANLRLMQL